jgi:CRISPR-associated endonuclease/helicase Cas3
VDTKILAHSPTELHPAGQPLQEHLEQVSRRAAEAFADEDLARLAALVGAWHDLGKAQQGFQDYLRTGKGHVDHSTSGGALLAKRLGEPWPRIVAPVILGHHGGIPDGAAQQNGHRATQQRLQDATPPEVERAATELPCPAGNTLRPPLCRSAKTFPFEMYLYCKLLHSALVDADYLDTEAYFQPDQAAKRTEGPTLQVLAERYDRYMEALEQESEPSAINALRRSIRADCLRAAEGPVGFYSLTVPTGGGKTLASLGFALRHAQAHPEMKKIIYAIPFCSIIEQNAAVFRAVLGDDAVLEHHSSAKAPEKGTEADLAAENWQGRPVVVTTNVQLFESLFSNQPSRCRKLHNLQNSILILDEMQALPDGVLKPCLAMLDALVKDAHATVVICTATQPEYQSVWVEPPQIREIVADPGKLFRAMKRTKGVVLGRLEESALVDRLARQTQVLCILNRRATVQRVARALGGEEAGAYHLSTMMCPAHRTQKLEEIRQRLKEGLPCRIISTSLIEAGVDIDLPVVYREAAGLDAIVQAAGRCNRNGKDPRPAPVYIFELPPEKGQEEVKRQGNVTLREILPQYAEDPLGPEALAAYFRVKFAKSEVLDDTDTLGEIYRHKSDLWFPFATIAEKFALIRNAGEPLFVPYDEKAAELLHQLPTATVLGALLRALQPYGVTIYENQKKELLQRGLIRQRDGICWLDAAEAQLATVYTEEFGLDVKAEAAFLCC